MIREIKRYQKPKIKRRRTKTRKTKPTTTSKADTLFSAFIRERDKKCIRCGKTERLQCSHFWPRAISSTRYDPENCDTLCYGCHYGDRYHGWEYAKQGEYRDFKIFQLGVEKYELLAEKAAQSIKRKFAVKAFMEWYESNNRTN